MPEVIADLRGMVERIPTRSFTVKRAMPEIEEAWKEGFWYYLVPTKLDF